MVKDHVEKPAMAGPACKNCSKLTTNQVRYKCLQCHLTFCEKCKDGGKHIHNTTHTMLRIPIAIQHSFHPGICCDKCGAQPIHGLRYKCLDCEDYDLCEVCKDASDHNKEESTSHKASHKMLLILEPSKELGNKATDGLALLSTPATGEAIKNLVKVTF